MKNKKQVTRGGLSTSNSDMQEPKMDIKSIMKDIKCLGSTNMTWKEKKELESKKVVSLGGKSMILGRFRSNHWRDSGRAEKRHRPQNNVLKSSEGHFRNGVLVVKHLLQPSRPKVSDDNWHAVNKGKKKGGKKNRSKKGAGRRHG